MIKTVNKIKPIIHDLVHNDLIPTRIAPTLDNSICLLIQKNDLSCYLEFYDDGDIGFIIEDRKTKKVIANEDVLLENLIKSLKKYLK